MKTTKEKQSHQQWLLKQGQGYKQCAYCHEIKPITEFGYNNKSGIQSYCNDCNKEVCKAYGRKQRANKKIEELSQVINSENTDWEKAWKITLDIASSIANYMPDQPNDQ